MLFSKTTDRQGIPHQDAQAHGLTMRLCWWVQTLLIPHALLDLCASHTYVYTHTHTHTPLSQAFKNLLKFCILPPVNSVYSVNVNIKNSVFLLSTAARAYNSSTLEAERGGSLEPKS